MPRIRQYEERYAAEDFRKEVRIRQGERDLMSVSALAEEADIPRTTLTKRLSNPMGMTFEEFRKLNRAARLDPTVVLKLLGYNERDLKRLKGGADPSTPCGRSG